MQRLAGAFAEFNVDGIIILAPPGGGKSSLLREFGASVGGPSVALHLAHSGMLAVNCGGVTYASGLHLAHYKGEPDHKYDSDTYARKICALQYIMPDELQSTGPMISGSIPETVSAARMQVCAPTTLHNLWTQVLAPRLND